MSGKRVSITVPTEVLGVLIVMGQEYYLDIMICLQLSRQHVQNGIMKRIPGWIRQDIYQEAIKLFGGFVQRIIHIGNQSTDIKQIIVQFVPEKPKRHSLNKPLCFI